MATTNSILSHETPALSSERIVALVQDLYGFPCVVQRRLSSERDQVMLIARSDDGEAEYILKVSNGAELEVNVELENSAAVWARQNDPELPVAGPLQNAAGEYYSHSDGHFIRLFPKAPGTASIKGSALNNAELKAYGEVSARFAKALRGFFHRGAARKLLWHVESRDDVRELMTYISDPDRRALVERAFARFDDRVAPIWSSLRAQVVHSDLTLDNVMLENGAVTGIIDFGDVTHTTLVADVAAALSAVGDMRQGSDLFRAFRVFLDGYQRISPLEPNERAALGDVLGLRLAVTVVLSAWQGAVHPNNGDYLEAWDDAAWNMLAGLDALSHAQLLHEFGVATPELEPTGSLTERRNRVFGSALVPLTYSQPLRPVAGSGASLCEANGNVVLDAYNNIPSLGYAHPRVVGAIAEQSRTLSTNLRYLHPASIDYAERLLETMPEECGFDTVLFVNSGSEANDLAWRIARAATGRTGAMVTTNAFHSVTMAGTELSPGEWLKSQTTDRVATFEAGATIDGAIDQLRGSSIEPGALFLDPIYGSDGILSFTNEYHAALSDAAHAVGARIVVDEVQAGFGRTGRHMWAFAAVGLKPDIVSLGKPMGNGYPVAALVLRGEDLAALGAEQEFFSSFAGSPVAAAAGLAVLDVIRDEGLVAESARKGEYLRARLREELRGHRALDHIHGNGLILGLNFGVRGAAKFIADFARQEGVLLSATGFEWDTIKVRPPLVITDAELGRVAKTIGAAVAAMPN
ncbi:MAG: aminotransferase class III-fold pyridoxal phosphate-dependent enzyme [Gulosibacter sp.]|uniref:aminotransferase class III-fold pyridoxal phosphate-dependent enzyme n=1 Tax=Gulosibacter sp. TaxID=2817531 RepID=UPI003F9007BF